MGWNFFYTNDRGLSAYATIHSNLPSFCDRTTPTPLVDQSTSKVKGLVKFGLTKIGVFTNASFKTLNAF